MFWVTLKHGDKRALLLTLFVLGFMAWSTVTVAEEMKSKYIRQFPGADTVIVFVHGVMGDAVSTWTSQNGAYWPKLLTEDATFDGTDIYAFSYPTGFWATLSIDELAENMRADLTANKVSTYKKIIFVSHSMGGLVTRAYLLKNKDAASRTSFAYFYSTPTTGSQIASLVQYISSSQQIVKMKAMNAEDYLADVYRQWLAAQFEFPSYCAYEKRATSGIIIVTMTSAAALCTRALVPIDTNHTDIVKPENRNSAPFIALKAAYTDEKIPELKTQLDYTVSLRIRSEIAELGRFPDGPDVAPPRTLLEAMMKNKLSTRIFGTLEHYNKSEITGIPGSGEMLYHFKEDYYDFQSAARGWEDDLTTKIGQKVSVRFRQAWQIYLRYVILRLDGQTKQSIIDQGNFLNYGITWDDAERVFLDLSNDPSFVQETAKVFASLKKVSEEATKIASVI